MPDILKNRMTIALLIDWLYSPYHSDIFSSVSEFSEKNDLNLICFVGGKLDSPFKWEKNRNVLFDFIDYDRIDGFLITTSSLENYAGKKAVENMMFKLRRIPAVSIGKNPLNIPSVTVDNETGIRDVMKHMVEIHGYKRIAFISGLPVNTDSCMRLDTYRRMLDYYKLPCDENLIYEGDFSIDSGKKAIIELLDKRKADFDAIVSSNDFMALGIMNEIKSRGKISSDFIPITGFDDIDYCKSVNLTSVRQPTYNQAWTAAELLLRNIRGEEIPQVTCLSTEFVVRESCGCYSADHFSIKTNRPYNLKNDREFIISSFTDEIKSFNPDYSWVVSVAPGLIDGLEAALSSGNGNLFFSAWNRAIDECYESTGNLRHLQNILLIFMSYTLSLIGEGPELVNAEYFFHKAQVMNDDAMQKYGLFQKIHETAKLEELSDFGAELSSTFDLEKQFDIIQSSLTTFGIGSCFISMYNYPENPKQEAALIFGYQNGARLDLPHGGIAFRPGEIIPAGLIKEEKRRTYILENMFNRESQLGFIMMELGPKYDKMYEIIRTKINENLMDTIMFQKIQKQTEELEHQVKKKTSEFYMMKYMKDRVESEVQKLTTHISKRQEKRLDEKSSIVYQSSKMQDVIDKVNQAIMISKPILITGDTGTGKELIAKLIHYTGNMDDVPFITVNCAAIPRTLWEEELFGHVKGSFTDAKSSREGKVEAAGCGTLFFDEIGEMPLDIQSKLLRLLQENKYSPIGSNMVVNSKCRFVFATNRDLNDMIIKGSFRDDLFYRISVFVIDIPPLRERKDDIPILADFLIKKYAGEFDLPPDLTIEQAAIEKIESYSWPGNIREMENFIIRAMSQLAVSRGDKRVLKLTHFPSIMDAAPVEDSVPEAGLEISSVDTYDGMINQYSRKIIEWALDKAKGNKSAAAAILGIKRTTLTYKIKEMKIE